MHIYLEITSSPPPGSTAQVLTQLRHLYLSPNDHFGTTSQADPYTLRKKKNGPVFVFHLSVHVLRTAWPGKHMGKNGFETCLGLRNSITSSCLKLGHPVLRNQRLDLFNVSKCPPIL